MIHLARASYPSNPRLLPFPFSFRLARWPILVFGERYAQTAVEIFVLLALIAGGAATVRPGATWARPPADGLIVEADWQTPEALPPQFRNHCAVDQKRGLAYCADHCGSDYQFYYCSAQSFGCCRINYGYCDRAGLLRCAP